MENKYYIPELSEIHVGLEFETANKPMTSKMLSYFRGVQKALSQSKIRVKVLDSSDIESLGWVPNGENSYTRNGDYLSIVRSEQVPTINITGKSTIFSGYLRNKSELIKLMQQLAI